MRKKKSEWAGMILVAAGSFYLLWGMLNVVHPTFLFSILGADPPPQQFFGRTLGLFSLVMAIGYFCAARDPARHWVIVLVGFLVSIAFPATIAAGILRGDLPTAFGCFLLARDIFWAGPFAFILHRVHQQWQNRKRHSSPDVRQLAMRARTNENVGLDELTTRHPTMVVFLRHFGCPFCREALAELASRRPEIEETGTRIVFVHMAADDEAKTHFVRYRLADLPRISDPACMLYRAFGLKKGGIGQVFGLNAWLRGFDVAILRGYGIGGWFDDLFQMPGVFLLFHGEVLNSYQHQSIADRPDYIEILNPTFIDDPGVQAN